MQYVREKERTDANHVPVLVSLGKGVAGKPVEKTGLADTRVADHQHLEAVGTEVNSSCLGIRVVRMMTNGSCAAVAMVNDGAKSLARRQGQEKLRCRKRKKKRTNEKKKGNSQADGVRTGNT